MQMIWCFNGLLRLLLCLVFSILNDSAAELNQRFSLGSAILPFAAAYLDACAARRTHVYRSICNKVQMIVRTVHI